MAWTGPLTDGWITGARSSEASNTIGQYVGVCMDTTTEDGFVRSDNANAGPFAGINESTGTTSAGIGGVSTDVQPGNTMRVAAKRFSKGIIANGVTVTRGDKLYITTAAPTTFTNVSSSNKFVGYADQTVVGDGATLCVILVNALSGV